MCNLDLDFELWNVWNKLELNVEQASTTMWGASVSKEMKNLSTKSISTQNVSALQNKVAAQSPESAEAHWLTHITCRETSQQKVCYSLTHTTQHMILEFCISIF